MKIPEPSEVHSKLFNRASLKNTNAERKHKLGFQSPVS